jgi:hypothetical protein
LIPPKGSSGPAMVGLLIVIAPASIRWATLTARSMFVL